VFPVKLHEFPRYPLTFGPSPVHPLNRLSDHLGGPRIWAKREDVNSGLAFGGNKTRKLEYIVPDALDQGADTLVSIGGVQSNHTRQVAAVAAHLGLGCRLVQERWVDWDDPVNDRVGNILLSRIMGADVRLDPSGFDIGIRRSWEEALAEVEAAGGKPYAIPAGASEHPLGGLGFANWAVEVAEQERRLGVFFDTVVVCTVTGSTHAGMIAGFAALQEAGDTRPAVCSASTRRRPWTRPAPRSSGSPGTPPRSSRSAATCGPTRSPCSRAGRATATASRSRRRSRRSGSPAGSRA
jgi:1-aminocyclopropane-1-carboxylate deaminase